MTSISDLNIDAAILSAVSNRWQKVAMIVGTVLRCSDGQAAGSDHIAGRIVALVDNGVLESKGNLSNWRRSEVRLKT